MHALEILGCRLLIHLIADTSHYQNLQHAQYFVHSNHEICLILVATKLCPVGNITVVICLDEFEFAFDQLQSWELPPGQ